jgi:hypothetical protein
MDETVIILIVLMGCFCCMLLMGGLGWFITRPEEGDECKGKDKKGEYEIDEDGKCVLVSCEDGYIISGKKCVDDLSGETCTPTTKVTGGVYKTDVAGDCVLDGCSMGYKLTTDGTKCERESCTKTDGDVDGIYLKSTSTINMCELNSCEEGTIMVAGNCHTVYTVSNVYIKNTGGAGGDDAIEVNSLKILDDTENRSKVILTDNDIVSTDTTHSNVTATGDSWASIAAGGKIDISLGNNTKISKVSFKVNNTTDKIQLLFDKKSQGTTTNTDSTKKTYTYDDGKWTYST